MPGLIRFRAAQGAGDQLAEAALEDSPTWIVAAVCSVMVLISFVFERALHRLGTDGAPELDLVRCVAEAQRRLAICLACILSSVSVAGMCDDVYLLTPAELMLMGFVSLLLVVFQDVIQEICIDEGRGWDSAPSSAADHHGAFSTFGGGGGARRILRGGSASGHCSSKGEVPLLSLHALEQIHIFIFVLAITHVVLSVITVLLGILQMRKWKHWENTIQKEGDSAPKTIIRKQIKFIQESWKGYDKRSFFKQFYGSLTKDDYVAMRLGFVKKHAREPIKFNFYDYTIKALKKDFKRVVGIKWYHWIFVMISLLLNVPGWHSYFWISLVPLVLLVVIGAKLEHIINNLAYEVVEVEAPEAGPGPHLVVSPSDELFWFRRPRLVLDVIHFILFQNAFELAYFVWTLATFGLGSRMMDGLGFSIARIAICVFVEVLCSYSTLPLYAIVTHMGSSFNSAMIPDKIAANIIDWRESARRRKRRATGDEPSGEGCYNMIRILLSD
ncbi:hypothetical protein ACP70R_032025 [Stipagrostis hirtigluma subsp. patula]